MRLIIRPIRYTSKVDAMAQWAIRLGMVPLVQSDRWVVLGAGQGRMALHHVAESDAADGVTTLAVETDDLPALQQVWENAGMATRLTREHDVALLFATTPFGDEIVAGELSPGDTTAAETGLRVMPILVPTDPQAAARWFTSWGLPERVRSEGGGWVDLVVPGDGGLLGIHHADNLTDAPTDPTRSGAGELVVSLSFEHPDVDALLARVRAAGVPDARVVDEAYNRTLLLECPDGDTIWVNGEQRDLYGYTRAGA